MYQCDIWVYCPDNPYANKSGRVRLHRRIVEIYAEHEDCFECPIRDVCNERMVNPNNEAFHGCNGSISRDTLKTNRRVAP